MSNRTAVLETIYARLVDPARGSSAVIVDPEWISALTSMPPDPERICRGDLWVVAAASGWTEAEPSSPSSPATGTAGCSSLPTATPGR